MSKVQAVIFDIGNVLIEWQPERLYDQLFGEERRRAMFAQVDMHGVNDQIDRGAVWKETIYNYADRYPEFRDMIRLWHDRWLDMASPKIDRSVALLRALRSKGVPVFALSNFGVETFAFAETHYPFLTEFDRRYISGHMKTAKPDADIYQMVEQDCGLPPESLLFVDDRQDNIDAANVRGWQTHLFINPNKWANALVDHGVLNQAEANV